MAVSLVTFPSPVKTPQANNNTVHCEYLPARPSRANIRPAWCCTFWGAIFHWPACSRYHLAQHGVAAPFVKMPYYGERRQPGTNVRMISTDPQETVRGLTQAVKDIRYAAAWLAAQDEVDAAAVGRVRH